MEEKAPRVAHNPLTCSFAKESETQVKKARRRNHGEGQAVGQPLQRGRRRLAGCSGQACSGRGRCHGGCAHSDLSSQPPRPSVLPTRLAQRTLAENCQWPGGGGDVGHRMKGSGPCAALRKQR